MRQKNKLLQSFPTGITRQDLIEQFSKELNVSESAAQSLINYSKNFFVNSGWRLTKAGYDLVCQRYTTYDIEDQDAEKTIVITGKIILNADQIINSPWYVRGRTIVVLDPVIAMELRLLNGNLKSLIDFKS